MHIKYTFSSELFNISSRYGTFQLLLLKALGFMPSMLRSIDAESGENISMQLGFARDFVIEETCLGFDVMFVVAGNCLFVADLF